MSNTRHAKPGTHLSQQGFASSPEFESGLLGNLVAKRCEEIESREDRALIWMIQYYSWLKGGLGKFAAELMEKFGSRVGTKSMRRFGVKPGAHYTREQVKIIRPELGNDSAREFVLRGEVEWGVPVEQWKQRGQSDEIDRTMEVLARDEEEEHAWTQRIVSKAASHPESYAVQNFLKECTSASQRLDEDLTRLCLDPATGFDSIWYFHELQNCLKDFQQAAGEGFAHTDLSRTIWREIADVSEMGGTVLLHNTSGNGKSFSAAACCHALCGRARYVATPSTNDEISFLREIAKSLGCASGLSFKAVQIRERILQTLQAGDLVLVIDSAQWLFPVTDYRYALPNRLNWVLTSLCESGVPVVMIADSKLFDSVGLVEARTGWNRSKLVNQLSRVVELPAALEKEDVQAVAVALLPNADRAAQRKLADYMIVAPGYLHSGEPAAQRARRVAASQGRDRVTLADMEAVLETSMKPSFKALADGLKLADNAANKCSAKVRNWRPETPAQIAAKSGKRRNAIVTSSDLKRPAVRPQVGDSEAAETDFNPSGTNRMGVLTPAPTRKQVAPDLVAV